MTEIQKVDNKRKFSEILKKVSFRFPVAEIASSTGYSKGSISEILKGNRSPTDEFIKKFSKAYNLELNDYESLSIVSEPAETYGLQAENLALKNELIETKAVIKYLENQIANCTCVKKQQTA